MSHLVGEIENEIGEISEFAEISHISLDDVALVENGYGLCINGLAEISEISEISELSSVGIDEFSSVESEGDNAEISSEPMAVTAAVGIETAPLSREMMSAEISAVGAVGAVE